MNSKINLDWNLVDKARESSREKSLRTLKNL